MVLDSGSTDLTLQICEKFNNVTVITRPFDNFAAQCNFGLQQINTDWVLSMDADYVLSQELIDEIQALQPDHEAQGFQISFRYAIGGKLLRGSLYPPRVCLYRKQVAHYEQDGHAHRVHVDGQIEQLSGKILHDDRKPAARWLAAQHRYAAQEATKLKDSAWHTLGWSDRARKLGLGPVLVLPYTLLVKGLLLDGMAGIEYARQRLIAEWLLVKKLFA